MKTYVLIAGFLLTQFSVAFAHSSALKPEFVDTLLAPYFGIQESLVKDTLQPAKTGSDNFLKALSNGPTAKDAPSIAKLESAAKGISKADEIEKAREAFRELSKEMILLVDHVGAKKTTAYQMHCSMAFDDTGASWLQADDKLLNPYWGARMLRCGHEEAVYSPVK